MHFTHSKHYFYSFLLFSTCHTFFAGEMISVGIRLADEVFPPPEEQIAKLPTNVSENPVMNLNGIDKDGKARVIF